MEIIEKKIVCHSRSDKFYLIPLGDIHIGTKNCDVKKLIETVAWIKKTPNTLWLGMGDYCDFILPSDKRFDFKGIPKQFIDSYDNMAQAQAKYVTNILSPIKSQCIGLIEGNHEASIRTRYHQDVTGYMSTEMGVPNLSYTAMIRLSFLRKYKNVRGGGTTVVIYASHGFGGGKAVGSKVTAITAMAKDFDADIYLAGHTHEKIAIDRDRLYITKWGKPMLLSKKQLFGITGSFYNTYEAGSQSYTERSGYSPSPTGVIKITIEPFKHTHVGGHDVTVPHLHISA
jgi:UDP-2,3-diacylglucosamine pyrophosphatase LpxH